MKKISEIVAGINRKTFYELYYEFDNLCIENISAYKIVKGQKIYRARLIEDDSPFNHVDQLSYNPWPRNFDRASSPSTPMFYGAISTNSNDYPIITNFSELIPEIRCNSDKDGEYLLQIAEFEVKEDLTASAIIFHEKFLLKNEQYRNLYEDFKTNYSNDFKILTEIAYRFSTTEGSDYDNRITAAFSAYVVENPKNNIDALMYPSTRAEGFGTNIAVHPISVREKLSCNGIKVVKLYKKSRSIISEYISETDLINEDGTFELREIPNRKGAELCYKKLDEMNNDK